MLHGWIHVALVVFCRQISTQRHTWYLTRVDLALASSSHLALLWSSSLCIEIYRCAKWLHRLSHSWSCRLVLPLLRCSLLPWCSPWSHLSWYRSLLWLARCPGVGIVATDTDLPVLELCIYWLWRMYVFRVQSGRRRILLSVVILVSS